MGAFALSPLKKGRGTDNRQTAKCSKHFNTISLENIFQKSYQNQTKCLLFKFYYYKN